MNTTVLYVYEGHSWPAILIRDNLDGTQELKFFPAAEKGLGDVVPVASAAHDAQKADGTWHHESEV